MAASAPGIFSLAQNGIIVWICDNRSASGKGVASAWPIYRNFGELELRDIEDGVARSQRHMTANETIDKREAGLLPWMTDDRFKTARSRFDEIHG